MQGASAHLTPEPMFTFDRNPEPPKPAPPPPASPPFSSEMPSIAPALPTPPEGYKATILDYPQAWQNLINSAGLQLLNDMLFAHPFPIGHDGREWAREAISTTAASFERARDTIYDKQSRESDLLTQPHNNLPNALQQFVTTAKPFVPW